MKHKKFTDSPVKSVPVSLTVADPAPVVESVTQPSPASDVPKWEITAWVVCENGKKVEAVITTSKEPERADLDVALRDSIRDFRRHLPNGVHFDNSAVQVSYKKL
jgi:hypothetical protein